MNASSANTLTTSYNEMSLGAFDCGGPIQKVNDALSVKVN